MDEMLDEFHEWTPALNPQPITSIKWIHHPTESTHPTSCLTRNGMRTKNGKTKGTFSLTGSLRHSTPWSSDRTTQVTPSYPWPPTTHDSDQWEWDAP
jgi:hypothetical protein